ncbi:GtrA family protein [Prosthecomicrobium sp. N25]|uniref:GtrA family protein n=1 Tax=Prosthecomicrobium sp. N25 TaxID=3129254 RepID=UPI0030778F5E
MVPVSNSPAASRPIGPTLRRLVAFGATGGAGFAIDAGLLWLLTARAGLDPFSARALSAPIAVAATWLLNRSLTFRAPSRGAAALAREGARYGIVAASGAGLNYLVYAAALLAVPGLAPVAALVAGSLAAMAFTYAGYARFAFRAED